jgi:hypothetical protein
MNALWKDGSTHPCSVLQCCQVVTDHRDNFTVDILGAHFLVMRRGVVFGEIVFYIFAAWLPVYPVLFLSDSISYPIEPHVHRLSSFFVQLVVQNSIGCLIVSLNWSGGLFVTHLF